MSKRESSILSDPDWRAVPGYPKYLVNRAGQVYSLHRSRLISPYVRNNSTCIQVSHSPKIQLPVRELVAAAWLPPVQGKPYVCHKNNDLTDARIENLEYRSEPQIRKGRRKDASHSKESVRAQLYTIWSSMKQRCSNSNHPSYANYGARGIGFCNDWRDFKPFYDWAINAGYRPGLSLDRRNNDEWYTAWNCRWTDPQTQARNTSRNRWIEAFGERKVLAAWMEDPRCSVTRDSVVSRLRRGISPELAISLPASRSQDRGHIYEAWGEQRSLRQWADDPRCMVARSTLSERVRQGWTVESAVSTAPRPRSRKLRQAA